MSSYVSPPTSALKVLREGVLPQYPTEALERTLELLRADDPKWIQGATTTPPPLQCVEDWPVEGCCFITLMAWMAEFHGDTPTVKEAEERFARVCHYTDVAVNELAGCRWFLNWHDETPRDEVRATLIRELDAEIHRRQTPV